MSDTKICGEPAALRYTWAGREEAFICIGCAPRLAAVANAMGYPLQMIPISPDFDGKPRTCSQHIKVKADPSLAIDTAPKENTA